jgi:hypothetical protein
MTANEDLIDSDVAKAFDGSDIFSPELAGRIIHQMRNPLGIITSGSSLLADSAGYRLGDEDRQILNSIQAAADRMTGILIGFQQLACPEQPHREPIEINEMCRSIAAETHQKPEDNLPSNLGCEFDMSNPRCLCDVGQIRTALQYILLALADTKRFGGEYSLKTHASSQYVSILLEARELHSPTANDRYYNSSPFELSGGKFDLGLVVAWRMTILNSGKMSITRNKFNRVLITISLPIAAYQEDVLNAVNSGSR